MDLYIYIHIRIHNGIYIYIYNLYLSIYLSIYIYMEYGKPPINVIDGMGYPPVSSNIFQAFWISSGCDFWRFSSLGKSSINGGMFQQKPCLITGYLSTMGSRFERGCQTWCWWFQNLIFFGASIRLSTFSMAPSTRSWTTAAWPCWPSQAWKMKMGI